MALWILCPAISTGTPLSASPEGIVSNYDWKTIGQGGGGNIVDVIIHPTDPEIIWIETDLTGIFKSTNAGISYDRMCQLITAEMRMTGEGGIEFSYTHPLTIRSLLVTAAPIQGFSSVRTREIHGNRF